MEKAYAAGQNDALHNDVRIKQLDDTTFVWVKN
jgi:hypothetical protein